MTVENRIQKKASDQICQEDNNSSTIAFIFGSAFTGKCGTRELTILLKEVPTSELFTMIICGPNFAVS